MLRKRPLGSLTGWLLIGWFHCLGWLWDWFDWLATFFVCGWFGCFFLSVVAWLFSLAWLFGWLGGWLVVLVVRWIGWFDCDIGLVAWFCWFQCDFGLVFIGPVVFFCFWLGDTCLLVVGSLIGWEVVIGLVDWLDGWFIQCSDTSAGWLMSWFD